jgi:heme O synthase-like polyprenyltransferase
VVTRFLTRATPQNIVLGGIAGAALLLFTLVTLLARLRTPEVA